MATKTFCDGCDADLTVKKAHSHGQHQHLPPVGEIGDGIQRSIALRIGGMTLNIESCPQCLRHSLEMLSTTFKVPVSEFLGAIGDYGRAKVTKIDPPISSIVEVR